jgi:hypothetical protein
VVKSPIESIRRMCRGGQSGKKRYLPKFSQTGTGVTMGILKSPCGFKTGMLLPALSFFRALSNGMAQFPVFGSTFRSTGAEGLRNAIGCALRRLRASAVAKGFIRISCDAVIIRRTAKYMGRSSR